MKVLAGMILGVVLGAMSLSIFHMSQGMDMRGNSAHCPFMEHEEVLCGMNLAEHLSAWKTVFTVVMPTILLLATAITLTTFVYQAVYVRATTLRWTVLRVPWRCLRERVYTFVYRYLQELFARGVLHPKYFR